MNLIHKQILEAKRLLEDASVLDDPKAIGLSQVDKKLASSAAGGGYEDSDKEDDKIDGGPDAVQPSRQGSICPFMPP